MDTALLVASWVLVLLGVFFLVASTVGLLKLPDLYTRAHAVAKSETLGLLLVFGGLFLRPELDLPSAGRLAFVLVFSLIANPTAVHALVRAAYRAGAEPWKVTDQASADAELGTLEERRERAGEAAPGSGSTAARRVDLPGGPGAVAWPLPYRDPDVEVAERDPVMDEARAEVDGRGPEVPPPHVDGETDR
jgi:multicomponent Na+:H+ antiporter subunit G